MKIRSITYFTDIQTPIDDAQMQPVGQFMARARQALEEAGFIVQTTRLALPPFARIIGEDANAAVALAQDVEAACFLHNIDYATIGPARLSDTPAHYQILSNVMRETDHIFAAAEIACPEQGIDIGMVKLVADTIRQNSTITEDGFGNLRFAALANVRSGTPFLPAAYHSGGTANFALAIEGADLALKAFREANSLAEARQLLQTEIERIASQLAQIAEKLGEPFGGIDFTLAPFPSDEDSIGLALESLGIPAVGLSGTLAAAAFVTDTIQRANAPLTGFSGLFMPVLEDSQLARRASEGTLTVNDLLLYASVCGTGLDTVPLPGDTTPEALTAILLDVAALALRLNKPLTARLMPIPGKVAGDLIAFDFPYFANGRVMAHRAQPLSHLLDRLETFHLAPHRSRK